MIEWVTLSDEDTQLFDNARDDLKNCSPRLAAIAANSLIEDALTSVLEQRLALTTSGHAKGLIHVMFAAGGPLADFDTKIDYAFGLALISKAACDELHSIYEIRRKFAYRVEEPTFDNPEMMGKCAGLRIWEDISLVLYEAGRATDGRLAIGFLPAGLRETQKFAVTYLARHDGNADSRERFVSACIFHLAGFLAMRNALTPREHPII